MPGKSTGTNVLHECRGVADPDPKVRRSSSEEIILQAGMNIAVCLGTNGCRDDGFMDPGMTNGRTTRIYWDGIMDHQWVNVEDTCQIIGVGMMGCVDWN